MTKLLPQAGAALAALLLSGTFATAAVIGASGYEGPPDISTGYYYTYAFDYAGYGNGGPNIDLQDTAVNGAATVLAGIGVGGSGGFQISGDSSAVPVPGQPYPAPTDPLVQYSYWGMGAGSGLAVISAPTSPNISDYRLVLDLRAVGLISAGTTIEFQVEFQAPDDTLGADADTGNDLLLGLNFSAQAGHGFTINGNFATYSMMLNNYDAITVGSLANFAQFGSLTSNINVNIGIPNGGGDFGIDGGNAVIVDNQTIEQVPEPATGALLSLSLAGLALRRRR